MFGHQTFPVWTGLNTQFLEPLSTLVVPNTKHIPYGWQDTVFCKSNGTKFRQIPGFLGFLKKFFLNQYLNKIFPHFCGAHCFDLHKFSSDTCSLLCVLICHKFSSSSSLLLNSHCDFSDNNSLLTKICCNYFNYLQFTSGKYMHLQLITKYTCQNAIFMAYMIVPVPTPVSLWPCIICGHGNCLCLLLSDQAITNRPFAHLLYIYSTLMVIRPKVSNYMRTRIELLY